MKYSIERLVRVCDDNHGTYIQISPDADGLDMVDIRSYDEKGEIESKGAARISMPLEQAILVSEALSNYLKQLTPDASC